MGYRRIILNPGRGTRLISIPGLKIVSDNADTNITTLDIIYSPVAGFRYRNELAALRA